MNAILFSVVCMLLHGLACAQEPGRFAVVIHEIFADPTPSVGLPPGEFIELKNTSATAFNLRNWKISDGSAAAVIAANYILMPDSLVVICPSASAPAFSVFGPSIGVSGFPSLNNDGDMISLISPGGSIIHSVEYGLDWYRNAVKSEGGWTIEMIDARNPCGGDNNWRASIDKMGGTPGRKNSTEGINPDVQPPALLRTYTPDSITIVAVFDEPLDSNEAATVIHYKLDKGLFITRATPSPPAFKQVRLTIDPGLTPRTVYTLTVSGLTDCSGNSIGIMNTARAGLPSEAAMTDMVINEILFNPFSNGTDYVECYNNCPEILDASRLFIASRDIAGNIGPPRKLSETPFLVFPGDFIVITADASIVRDQYFVQQPLNMLVVAQLPSLPDEKGNIALLNRQGTVIDELSYDEKWHFPLIANREGIALERIDYNLPTQNKDNWMSAASVAGYGTPTYRNSQCRANRSMRGKLEISPPVFSPDGDGRNDLCFIQYQFPQPNYVASVAVFDVNGMPVRNLYRNITLQEQGMLRWDGLDNKGTRVPVGVYIILAEVFSLDGKKKNFKNVVTIAHSF